MMMVLVAAAAELGGVRMRDEGLRGAQQARASITGTDLPAAEIAAARTAAADHTQRAQVGTVILVGGITLAMFLVDRTLRLRRR